MTRNRYFSYAAALIGILLGSFVLAQIVVAQQTGAPSAAQITPDQQKQLESLEQLETKLQEDRATLQNAITQYGWDSDQVDAAQERLSQDRIQYKKLRRSLVQAGVSVPPAAGFGQGARTGQGPGMRSGCGGGCWGHCHHCNDGCGDCGSCGHGHHGCEGCADCPGCGM